MYKKTNSIDRKDRDQPRTKNRSEDGGEGLMHIRLNRPVTDRVKI